MRFTSILLALPFVASVFAVPVSNPIVGSDLEARSYAPQCPTQYSEVLSIVTELQTSIHAIKKPTYASTQVEVEACLEAVVSAFDKCGKALGIELSLDLDIDLQIQSIDCTKGEKDVVAGIFVDVVKVVKVIIGGVNKKLCKKTVIDLLLKKIDHAVHIVLKVVDCLLVGVLDLVKSLLLVLGIKLNNLLGCLLGSLFGWC